MIDDMPITVATPMTTPSTVRNERSLFFRNESNASSRVSLISQRHDGVEIGSFGCRIDTEKEPDGCRNREAESNGPPFDGCGKRREIGDRQGYRAAQQNSDNSSDHCEGCRFHQELHQNVMAPRARRLPDSDLTRTFG